MASAQTLVAADVGLPKRERSVRGTVHARLVRKEAGFGATNVVVGRLQVEEIDAAMGLGLVSDGRRHLRHGVVETFSANVPSGWQALVLSLLMPRRTWMTSQSSEQTEIALLGT